MKAILAAALILALGITGISLWSVVHAQRMAFSSSQIFIDGTPVCVMQHGRDIIASVGTCDTPGREETEDRIRNGDVFHGRRPGPLVPGFGLPPGHPPIDSPPDMDMAEGRRILI
ncbi:MAG: hypothetical protein WAV26_04055 [Candidatus Deferrimicrobium sp.]